MLLNLREQPVKQNISHYIPWNILLCWCLGFWALLCVANHYNTDLVAYQDAANISECKNGIISEGQSEKNMERIASQRFWESLAIPQLFFRISEVFLVLSIVLLIVCTQRYVKQELDKAKRLVRELLKPFANEQAAKIASGNNSNATHSDTGMGNERMKEFLWHHTDTQSTAEWNSNPHKHQSDFPFERENERCNAGGDFYCATSKIVSEVHESLYCEFPPDSEHAPEFCGMKLRRMKMESHAYSEVPCSFKHSGALKPRFITASPEFQEFLLSMKELTRGCCHTD